MRDELRGEVAIAFDDGEMLEALQQWNRQCAESRPDLDQVVVELRIDGGDDAVDVVPIDQEILTEALARDVTGRVNPRSSRG